MSQHPEPLASRSSLEDMDAYRYKSLLPGEIRLLKLLPGEFNDRIVVELSHQRLVGHRDPEYEALSYTWGSRENPGSIQIKDAEEKRVGTIKKLRRLVLRKKRATLGVTQNLEAALHYLRKPDVPRVLWIDAICIDQENTEEKSVEVNRMGGIYNWAVEVVIWLGVSTPQTQSAIALFHRIGQDVEWNYPKNTPHLKNNVTNAEILEQLVQPFDSSYTVDERAGIQDLLDRPWFSRLWIWQEVCQARAATILCGDHQLSWDLFSTAVLCIHRQVRNTNIIQSHEWNDLAFETRTRQTSRLTREAKKLNTRQVLDFSVILNRTEYASCEDAKDRIYAQISMLPKALRVKIVPDYRKDKSQIYSNAFWQYSTYKKNLRLLEQCEGRPLDKSLPSWVPNWAAPRDSHELGNGGRRASSGSKAEINLENETVLIARGVHVADVTDVSAQMKVGCGFEDVLHVFNLWAQQNSHKTGKNGALCDAYCHTIVCGNLKERFPAGKLIRLRTVRDMLRSLKDQTLSEGQKYEKYFEEGQNDSDLWQTFKRDAVKFCGGRRFVTTSQGHVGLGPGNIESGDIICVLLGLDFPIALRPVDHNQFIVVGCCYIHGLMDGQGILGSLPETWSVEARMKEQEKTSAIYIPFFVNSETELRTQEDPRLWQLPPGWSSFIDEDGEIAFRNKKGRTHTRDPRLTSEELEKHGIKTRDFRII